MLADGSRVLVHHRRETHSEQEAWGQEQAADGLVCWAEILLQTQAPLSSSSPKGLEQCVFFSLKIKSGALREH